MAVNAQFVAKQEIKGINPLRIIAEFAVAAEKPMNPGTHGMGANAPFAARPGIGTISGMDAGAKPALGHKMKVIDRMQMIVQNVSFAGCTMNPGTHGMDANAPFAARPGIGTISGMDVNAWFVHRRGIWIISGTDASARFVAGPGIGTISGTDANARFAARPEIGTINGMGANARSAP
jgi:hypothetical protein